MQHVTAQHAWLNQVLFTPQNWHHAWPFIMISLAAAAQAKQAAFLLLLLLLDNLLWLSNLELLPDMNFGDSR